MPRPARQSPASRLAASAIQADEFVSPQPDHPFPSAEPASDRPVGGTDIMDRISDWAEAGPARALQARLDDHYARAADDEKLPIRTRIAIIVGASLGLWSMIIGGIALLLN